MNADLKTISVRISPELMARVDNIIVPKKMPRTTWLFQALTERLEKDEEAEALKKKHQKEI